MMGDAGTLSAVLAISISTAALDDIAQALRAAVLPLAAAAAVDRMVVNVADVDPGTARWVRPGEEEPAPLYKAVVELTVARPAFGETLDSVLAALASVADRVHVWRVTRLPARVGADATPGGIKYLVLCAFHDDLSDRAARRSWDHHVPLALRIHEGASRYVRSWFDAPLTPATPPFQGMTELYFPTRGDMERRWFGGDDRRAEIVQDIGHFLRGGVRLYTTEHVLKDLPA